MESGGKVVVRIDRLLTIRAKAGGGGSKVEKGGEGLDGERARFLACLLDRPFHVISRGKFSFPFRAEAFRVPTVR